MKIPLVIGALDFLIGRQLITDNVSGFIWSQYWDF